MVAMIKIQMILLLTAFALVANAGDTSDYSSVPRSKRVFLTIHISNEGAETALMKFVAPYAGAKAVLEQWMSFEYGNIQFRAIITSSREKAVEKLTSILKPGEEIVGLHIVAHGSSEDSSKRSTTFLSKVGTISVETHENLDLWSLLSRVNTNGRGDLTTVDSEVKEFDLSANMSGKDILDGLTERRTMSAVDDDFKEFFSPIRNRISKNARIVFTSCNAMTGEFEQNLAKAKAVGDYFGNSNGSIYFSSTLDSLVAVDSVDQIKGMVSIEGLKARIYTTIAFSVLIGADMTGGVHSLSDLSSLLMSGAFLSLGVDYAISFAHSIINLISAAVPSKRLSGWLFDFSNGRPEAIEIADKRASYRLLFSPKRSKIIRCRAVLLGS